MPVFTVNKENFHKEVISSEQPVLIDFWAPWCGPCKMFSPVIDQVAEENEDSIRVAKINIDEEPELAQRFGVMSIPTLVLVKHGKAVTTSVGLRPKQFVQAMLE